MKRKTETPKLQDVACLTLYKDDLEYIDSVLKKPGEKLTIETDEYELSAISDLSNLSEKGRTVKEIVFIAGDSLVVTINESGAWFYFSSTSDSNLDRLGAAKTIRDYFIGKRNKLSGLLYDHFQKISYVWILYSVALVSAKGYEWQFFWQTWFCLGILSIGVIASGRSLQKKNTKIYVVLKPDELNFWERNREKILIGIIIAIATLFATLILTPLITRFLN